MNPPDLDQLLRQLPAARQGGGPAVDFADAILARLPGMRFVIPGSHPGLRILLLAGVLGLLTAIGTALWQRRPARPVPPPLTLFQPSAAEPTRLP